ncbi:MAG: response regulator [Planctomycetota bacterium]|jgi:two-component system response regulator ResD
MSELLSILVIEDDELTRRALQRSLRLYGFEVCLAKDGPAGLRLAQEKRPAFILLDWMMPDVDGLEVLSELKQNKKTEDIPVFMLTGRGMIGDLDEAFELGADDYIVKPLDLTDLGRTVTIKWKKYTNRTGVSVKPANRRIGLFKKRR